MATVFVCLCLACSTDLPGLRPLDINIRDEKPEPPIEPPFIPPSKLRSFRVVVR